MIQQPIVRRAIRVLLVLFVAYAALLSLGIHDLLSDSGWRNSRYSGPDGALLGLVQGLVTMGAGAYLGWRIGWKFVSGSKPDLYKEEVWKWVDMFVSAVLAFSIWAANF